MATKVGTQAGAIRANDIGDSAKGRFVTLTGVRTLNQTSSLYKLAMVDAGGVRRFWMSRAVATTEAPTAGVSLPYDTATLTVEGLVS